jgi:hypothetical protein
MDISQLLGNRLIDGAVDAIATPILNWLAAHPLWQWLFSHPFWLLGIVLLAILLLAGLLGAIGRLTENLWMALLRFPFWLTQWLFKQSYRLFLRLLGRKDRADRADRALAPVNQQERLADILNRLDAIQQEQDALLQEVRTILAKETS